jgi:hypothetical protein
VPRPASRDACPQPIRKNNSSRSRGMDDWQELAPNPPLATCLELDFYTFAAAAWS